MKIFVASSAELRDERMELVDLMLDLNDELEGQATKLKPVLWEFMDSSMGTKRKEDEYLEKLRECEICLVLFWKTLGNYTVEELDEAVAEMNAGKLPKKVVALFKEPADGIKSDLDDFKRSFSHKYPSIPVKKFQNMKELRELATNIVKEAGSFSNSPKEQDETRAHSCLKTIKVMIAAPDELHREKMDFSGLVESLNEVLEQRGIELKRVKWNPEVDGSLEDYQAKLHDCEMCLTLYWRDLVGNSQDELDSAYRELGDNNNPRKLYVFFKEPSDGITELLREFKASFETKYGYFYCKFENVDTMNLHFILQFEAYQNDLQRDFVKVSKGKVMVGGKEMVDLQNVPFAALNKEYQRLQKELAELDNQLADAKERYIANPDNEVLEKDFVDAMSKRDDKAKELEKYQNHLYDIALNFAKISEERYSERIRLAREQFEKGNNIEADEILNMAEMKREAERESEQFEQSKNNLELKVEEFRLKADTVMLNTSLSIPNRFSTACDAFQEAIRIAKKINYDTIKYAKILFDYAQLLQEFKKLYEAVNYYKESLGLFRRLAKDNPAAYMDDVACTLNNLANLHSALNRPVEAEAEYKEALEICWELAKDNPAAYIDIVAQILNNLAILYAKLNRFDEAEEEYKVALEIRRRLARDTPALYTDKVAESLNNLGNLHKNLNRYDEAEAEYKEALEIRRRLVNDNPGAFMYDVFTTLNNMGLLHSDTNRYDEAEAEYKEALEISRGLAKDNPAAYMGDVAITLNNLAILHSYTNRYGEAEAEYKEALETYRKLVKKNPDAYMDYVATTLNNFADLHNTLNRYDEAEAEFKEALETYRGLAKDNPATYLAKVAMTLHNLGFLHFNLNRDGDAEAEYKEALEIRRGLAKDNSNVYIDKVAQTLYALALLHYCLNRHDEAEAEYKEALETYKGLAKNNSCVYIDKVAQTLHNLGLLHFNLNRPVEAEAEYKEALEIYRGLTKINPVEYTGYVAKTLHDLGLLHFTLNRHVEAETEYKEALEIYMGLTKINPVEYTGYLAKTLHDLGLLHFNLNRHVEAEEEYKEALEIYRGLTKINPVEYTGYVAKTLHDLGLLHYSLIRNAAKTLYDLGLPYFNLYRFGEAEAEYKEALEIWRRLVKDNSDKYKGYMADSYYGLALLYASLKLYSKTIASINKAIAIMPENAKFYDIKGEILLINDDDQGAVAMWRKVIELDPDFLSKYNGETELHRQLKEKGLIEN